jgi:hypothetical protein
MTREEARSKMPVPPQPFVRGRTNVDAFLSIQVNYSAQNIVDFIEVAPRSNLRLMFDGRNLCSLSMRELVALFSVQDRCSITEGTTYNFYSLRVALWRDAPHDVELDGPVESISTWSPGYWS